MSEHEPAMADSDLGRATIVYEDRDGDTVETEVDAEYVVYFGDHWQVKTGEDEHGNDIVRRIPRERVVYVERTVEQFQNRVDAIIDRAKNQLDFG